MDNNPHALTRAQRKIRRYGGTVQGQFMKAKLNVHNCPYENMASQHVDIKSGQLQNQLIYVTPAKAKLHVHKAGVQKILKILDTVFRRYDAQGLLQLA
jgi:hypothetical protein